MNEWLKADLTEGKEPVIPSIGQSVVLYLCPRDRTELWQADIGSLDVESPEVATPLWESAFGYHSAFDGLKFRDILNDYEVCFAEVPPLEYGRFPAPLGISPGRREGVSRADLRRILGKIRADPIEALETP